MSESRPIIHTVPTELQRKDAFYDTFVLGCYGWAAGYCIFSLGVPWYYTLIPAPFIALWSLTGAPAADVSFVGNLSAALRSKFGQRRASEWVLAWIYFWQVAVYPVWRSSCVKFLGSIRQQISVLPTRLNAVMPWRRSRAN